ncbi:restriction endonuclease subunit S [Psychrobacillus psychrotolerans]|uniref:restriction endonuclease subunit S n=1 Tax=Psychrobacillus psychrotolerans TaxID=126156 RepID=UPI001587DE19|nr:restriction endonuclease subunit S [Psychrobacillus psychrotolerans]
MEEREGYKITELGEIPVEWEIKRLEDVVLILDGKRKPIKKNDRKQGEIPYYGATGIIDWVKDYIFNEPLILVGEDGENLRSRVLPMAFKVSGKTWVNNHAHVLKPSDEANIDYLTYHLESLNYEDYITGSAQPKLNQAQLRKIIILLPSIEEQQKIAKVLSTVDEQVDNTQHLIEKAKELKKGLMQQLLTKGIGHTKYKQTELGEIPAEWKLVSLESISEKITYGFTNPMPTTVEGPFMITAKDIKKGRINYDTARKTDLIKFNSELTEKSKPRLNDILITKDGTLGRMAIVDTEDICINQSVASISLKNNEVDVKYLFYLLSSPKIQSRILLDAGGSTIKHIYISKLAKMEIFIANSIEEQQKIALILSTVDEQIESYVQEKAKYKELKKGLMKQLFTGQLRVKL